MIFLPLHARLDDAGHVGGQDVGVGHARGQKLHGHALVVDAHVEGAHHLHLVLQVAALELLDQGELEELGLVALLGAGVLDQNHRGGAVEGQGAVAPWRGCGRRAAGGQPGGPGGSGGRPRRRRGRRPRGACLRGRPPRADRRRNSPGCPRGAPRAGSPGCRRPSRRWRRRYRRRRRSRRCPC